MASINGALSPPSNPDSANPSPTLSAKRKREESTESQNHINGISNSTDAVVTEETNSLIKDLIDVLKIHDPSPSILTRALPERTSATEPQAKRQKSEASSEPTTILARVSSNAYTSLDDVLDDIDSAVDDIMEKLDLTSATSRIQYQPVEPRKTELSLKASAFKQRAHELVEKENELKKQTLDTANTTSSDDSNPNGKALTHVSAKSSEKKLVLTLFGNAPQAKQLFSSLQLPTKVAGENQDVVQVLREAGLPNGISTTQVVPIQSTIVADDKKRVPTLGDLFPSPSTIPQFQPPKPSKVATTRSSTVGWYNPASSDLPPSRSLTYSRQSISTGHWLDYSNASSSQSAKRKQRDRAMSLSVPKTPQMDVEPAESEAAKLDALFRSAYSGFAPTKDDAAAIVPEGVINKIWWQRVGEKSFERLVENANRLEDVIATESDEPVAVIDDAEEDKNFREAVEWFEAEAIDPNLDSSVEKSAEEKDVEEILDGISDLLETLNSYQRIRHMTLNPTGRPAGLLSTADTSTQGTPSKPGEAEIATYEILKSQLSLMIASLPPFAVAKLDPNQLAELSISTKIPIQVENYKGVMEEDEVSSKAKAAALNAASASRVSQPTSLPRTGSAALYGNQYAARPAAPQYYGAQTPIRPPVNNMQRPSSTAPAPFPAQRPSATPYRPASYGTPTYPHQNPRPIQQQYTAHATQQYLSTPQQGYARPVGQPYQGAPQSGPQVGMNTRYPQASYSPQTATQTGANYQYSNGSNTGHQPSPQKAMYSPQPTSTQAQGRPAYSNPTSTMTPDRRPYLQNPMMQTPLVNGGSSQSPQPQPVQQQPLGPTNYSTFMTTEQQSSMMERQRAQLAQQQAGTQQQARQMAQAAMGSPSKATVNGSPVPAGI